MGVILTLQGLPAVRLCRRCGAFRVIGLQWLSVGLPSAPLAWLPRRGICEDPGRDQLCTFCVSWRLKSWTLSTYGVDCHGRLIFCCLALLMKLVPDHGTWPSSLLFFSFFSRLSVYSHDLYHSTCDWLRLSSSTPSLSLYHSDKLIRYLGVTPCHTSDPFYVIITTTARSCNFCIINLLVIPDPELESFPPHSLGILSVLSVRWPFLCVGAFFPSLASNLFLSSETVHAPLHSEVWMLVRTLRLKTWD